MLRFFALGYLFHITLTRCCFIMSPPNWKLANSFGILNSRSNCLNVSIPTGLRGVCFYTTSSFTRSITLKPVIRLFSMVATPVGFQVMRLDACTSFNNTPVFRLNDYGTKSTMNWNSGEDLFAAATAGSHSTRGYWFMCLRGMFLVAIQCLLLQFPFFSYQISAL